MAVWTQRPWQRASGKVKPCLTDATVDFNYKGAIYSEKSVGEIPMIPPASFRATLVDLHSGLGHRFNDPDSYWPTIIAIVMASPGVRGSSTDRSTICELSRDLKSSYSPARTFWCPKPS